MGADVFVIGGGPAGLAAAIAARRAGLSVAVADGNLPPVDKACGEGLLPDAIAALEELGIELPAAMGYPLRGIRFCSAGRMAQAPFPERPGRGVRRLELHNLLRERAEAEGVELRWGTPVSLQQLPDARWVIGADGAQSLVRRLAGFRAIRLTRRRYASRLHFARQPWTDLVEVHWGRGVQLYVTPVGDHEVGVACIAARSGVGIDQALAGFPDLARRLGHAPVVSRTRGAVTATTRLREVTCGRVALAGDASGTVDAITGEGLGLAFRQAAALGRALAAGSLEGYERAHRQLAFRPRAMSRVLLLLDRYPMLLNGALRLFEARPMAFRRLLALHVGSAPGR